MCKTLGVSRAGYYKYKEPVIEKDIHRDLVVDLFRDNRRCYGTRRIKQEAARKGVILSRRRIGRIMHSEGLISKYTVAKFKPQKVDCNQAKVENIVNREFNNRKKLEVVVSDLTYVRVGNSWNYICTLIDLYNREIIGYSVGEHKTATLVDTAFSRVKYPLNNIQLFHTDRGKEFDNELIDDKLAAFDITRSLSRKGTPHDNAVAEATYKNIKFEFVYGETFESITMLEQSFQAYVWWYNNKRLHSSLGYRPPKEVA